MISEASDKLFGLVLAGGKSVRMGNDKGTIQWHSKAQRYHMADVLNDLCDEVYISCREEQREEIEQAGYKVLVDKFEVKGPYAGILTAFDKEPNAAWLVTACDLPLLDTDTLQYLITNRDRTKIATTFESPFDGLPEPLITIWEPASSVVLQSFVEKGISCPRKTLINSDVRIVKAPSPDALMNVNTKEDALKVQTILGKQMVP